MLALKLFSVCNKTNHIAWCRFQCMGLLADFPLGRDTTLMFTEQQLRRGTELITLIQSCPGGWTLQKSSYHPVNLWHRWCFYCTTHSGLSLLFQSTSMNFQAIISPVCGRCCLFSVPAVVLSEGWEFHSRPGLCGGPGSIRRRDPHTQCLETQTNTSEYT